MFINFILSMILIFLSIAFFTIMERKILGIFHIRLGPNKVGIFGMLQPFSDALKLFSKNLNNLLKINEFYWNFSPLITFFLFTIIIMFIPMKMENNNFLFNMLLLLFILGLPSFTLFWSSFFSFSKFSIISSKRCISQILSYEMGLMMILIFMFCLTMNMNMENMINKMMNLSITKYLMMLMFFILILSETSRIPFDFIEGESELVSGFNIEYSSMYFSLFFIYEYGMMLFFCVLMSFLFSKFIISLILIYLFINIRASFPRFRYDQMMIFIWKFIYPILISITFMMKTFLLN